MASRLFAAQREVEAIEDVKLANVHDNESNIPYKLDIIFESTSRSSAPVSKILEKYDLLIWFVSFEPLRQIIAIPGNDIQYDYSDY